MANQLSVCHDSDGWMAYDRCLGHGARQEYGVEESEEPLLARRRKKTTRNTSGGASSGPKRRLRPGGIDAESPRSVAVTVGWMLAALATLLAVAVAALAAGLARLTPDGMWMAVSRYLLVTACITSVVAIALQPVVRAVRPQRAPVAVERAVWLIAVLPWVWMLWVVWQAVR